LIERLNQSSFDNSNSTVNVVNAVRTSASFLWDILRRQSRYDNHHVGLCYQILRFSACLPVFLVLIVFAPAIFLLLPFCGIFLTEIIPTDAKHVPMFYAFNPRTKHDDISVVLFFFFGLVFGGVHYIWSFEFPTTAERNLWRAASISTMVIPFVFGLSQVLSMNNLSIRVYRQADRRANITCKIAIVVHVVLSAVQLLVYILARLLLIVQALVLLREQPASAFQTVDCTKFIPHY